MKNILFIALIMLTNLAQCQITPNIITETEFDNIKINNITLTAISATNGNEAQVRNLIPAIIQEKTIEPEENYFYYKYDGFEIGFSDNLISGFKITNSDWSVTIKGNTVTIGDDITILGSIIFNTKRNGNKGIIYQSCEGCNNYLGIDFNQSTNKITRIYFIEQT